MYPVRDLKYIWISSIYNIYTTLKDKSDLNIK